MQNITLMRIGVMAAQQTLTLLVEVRVLYPWFLGRGAGYFLEGVRLLLKIVYIGVWLSLVERYVRDVEVACSNHVTPILPPFYGGFSFFRC